MENKINKKKHIISLFTIVVLTLLLLGIIVIFIWDIHSRTKDGWDNNDTIQLVFIGCLLFMGLLMSKSFLDFFVGANKGVLYSNNEIHRHFISMENKGEIEAFEESLIKEESESQLKRIEKVIRRKDKKAKISIDNLNNYFNEELGIYDGEIKLGFFSEMLVTSMYKKIEKHKSIKFEKLYRLVHSGELLEKKKFPLIEIVLQLLFGVVGMFATIYQTLNSNGSINEPLLNYFVAFASSIFFAFAISLYSSTSAKRGKINQNKELLNKMLASQKSTKNPND